MKRYSTSFKTVGAAYDESLTLLLELNNRQSWEEVRDAAFRENLLKKRSSSWIEHLIRYVRKRYLEDHPPLPNGRVLSKFLYIINSYQARIQTLYQYICETYPLIDQLMVVLVGENLSNYNIFRLTKFIFNDFISREAEIHPEIKEWADYTKAKYRRDFFAFLRSSGLMEKDPSVLVRKFVVRLESFAFFLYGLIDEGLSPSQIFDSRLWARYFFTHEEIAEKLSECQVRGWLQYRSMGGISELIPKYSSLEEWVDALE